VQRELDLVACYLRISAAPLQRSAACQLSDRAPGAASRAAVPGLAVTGRERRDPSASPARPGGTIEIRADRRGGRLELQVVDDGAGMQPGHARNGSCQRAAAAA